MVACCSPGSGDRTLGATTRGQHGLMLKPSKLEGKRANDRKAQRAIQYKNKAYVPVLPGPSMTPTSRASVNSPFVPVDITGLGFPPSQSLDGLDEVQSGSQRHANASNLLSFGPVSDFGERAGG